MQEGRSLQERNKDLAMGNCFYAQLGGNSSELWELMPKYVIERELATAKLYRKGQPIIYKAITPEFLELYFNLYHNPWF